MSNHTVTETLERLRKIKEYSWYAVLFAASVSCVTMSNEGLILRDYVVVGGIVALLMIGGLTGILITATRILWLRRLVDRHK